VFGYGGKQVRDNIHSADLVQAFDHFFRNPRSGEVYNIGARNEQYNIDVVRAILAALGKDESLIEYVTDRLGHDRRYAIDPTKAETELGWKPLVSWEDGLRQTIHWYRENADWVADIRSGEYRNYYKAMYGREISNGK
jgi:dTDP-glucose 4,6-dehydratase